MNHLSGEFGSAGKLRERFAVVLVAPRNPLNIGAAARAMANFGFRALRVAGAYEPSWREARSAVGAPELLENASESATLAEAVGDCTLVFGTGSLAYRKPEQPVVPLPELGTKVAAELERGGRVALVFGPEKHGLTREDLSYCHALVEIPTDPRQPSMNLGQAVAVCLYELAARGFCHTVTEKSRSPENRRVAASAASLELLSGLVEEVMEAAHYSPALMREANRHDLRLLLRRLGPTEGETRRILGVFRRILWRLKRAGRER